MACDTIFKDEERKNDPRYPETIKKVINKLLKEYKERVDLFAKEQAEEKERENDAMNSGEKIISRGTSICSTKRESLLHPQSSNVYIDGTT
mgnify:CR=1 FL=1